MKRFSAILIVLFLAGMYFLPSASAKSRMGTVKMKNGGRIYGEILKEDSEMVVLRFAFGRTGFGEIKIDKVFVALENGITYESDMQDTISIPGGVEFPFESTVTSPSTDTGVKTIVPETATATGTAEPVETATATATAKKDPGLLGETVAKPGMFFSLRPPLNWNEAEYPVEESVKGQKRTMLVFTGATSRRVTQRILVGRMPAIPLIGSEREEFAVNLMSDFAPATFIKRHDGKVNAPTFDGETYFVEGGIFVEGGVGQVVFRHNFYFAEKHTYVLAFYAAEADFASLSKVFDAVTKSFRIQEVQ